MACSHTSSSTRRIPQKALLRSSAHGEISLCPCSVVRSLLLLFLLIASSAYVAQGDGSSEGSGSSNIDDVHPSAASSAVEPGDGQQALNNLRGKHELETTFDGTAGLAGIMFGVLNTSPSQYASITGLVLHTSAEGEVPVQIYSKSGSHMDFDMDPRAWTMVAEAVVEGRGEGQMTPIPDGAIKKGSLLLPPGEAIALYVTLAAASRIEGETLPALLCTDGVWFGAITAQSYFDKSDGSSVILFEGKAVSYPLSDNLHAPCIFNGVIEYDTMDLVGCVNASEKTRCQSAESTQSTTQPARSGEEENSKEVTAHLVLKLQTLTSTMDNDALLVLQAVCQSFLGELYQYTQPLVRELQCQVRGQMIINDRRRRGKLDGSTKMTKEHEAGSIKRTVGEGGEMNQALQVELLVKGNVDMDVPISYEKIGFEETTSDFFAIVSGRFIAVLREVSDGAGVSYFDTVYAVSVMQQSTTLHKATPTKGGNSTETTENRGDWDKSSGGVSTSSGEGLPLGLMIFLLIISINILGILVFLCLIQHRRARKNDTKWRFTDHITCKFTPRGVGSDMSVTSPPTQPRHTPSEPPMSPHDVEDGDNVNNSNGDHNCSDKFNKKDDATNATCPPLGEVACSNTDDNTLTSRLDDFESVASGAAKERIRERAAAAISKRIALWRRHSTASSAGHSATATGGGGGGAAIAVDEYIGDDISSNQISLVPVRGTPEEEVKGSGGIDSGGGSNSCFQVSTFCGQRNVLTGQVEGILSVNQKSIDGIKVAPRSSPLLRDESLPNLIPGVAPSLTLTSSAMAVCLPSPTSAIGEDGAGDNKNNNNEEESAKKDLSKPDLLSGIRAGDDKNNNNDEESAKKDLSKPDLLSGIRAGDDNNNNNEEESAKKDLSKPGLLSGVALALSSFMEKMVTRTDDNPAAVVSLPLPSSSADSINSRTCHLP